MDFHSLTRKELQTLCKKNKIPANKTNVAMADALAALQQVEGLDEFFNPREPDAQQFQEEKVVGTPDIHRTACRTSTRRKAVREESESSKVPTRIHRGTRAGNAAEVEHENKDVNVPVTPAVPSSRRRAPAISTRRKKEPQMPEDEKNGDQGNPKDVPETPAGPSSRTRATGRSVCTKIETPGGTSVQPAYNTRRSVRLLEENLAKMSLMDAEDEGLEKIDVICEEMSNVSQQKDSGETEKVYDVGASFQTVSTVVSEKTDELEVSSREKNTEYEGQSHDSDSEVQFGSAAENDVGANLQAEPQEVSGKISCLEAEPHESNLKLEVSPETDKDSNVVFECCDESVVENKSIEKAVHADNEAGSGELEDSCDFSEPENKKCLGTKQDALSVEVYDDAFIDAADQDVAALPVEVPDDASIEITDQDVSVSLPVSSVSADSVSLKELVECDIDNQGSNDDNQDKNNETGHWNVAYGNDIQNEVMFDVDEKAADENDLGSPEEILDIGSSNFCSSGEQPEKVGAKVEQSEESKAEIEKMGHASDGPGASAIVAAEKDSSSENSIAVIQACIESSADENMNVANVTSESSLLDVDVHKADDQKNNSEKLEAKAQPEEYKEHAAAEQTVLDATNAFPCVLDGTCSPQILIIHQQVSAGLESAVFSDENSIDSCSSDALMPVLSCNTNTLVSSDVIPEEIAIPKQESLISAETMKHGSACIELYFSNIDEVKLPTKQVAQIYEQKTSDIPIQSIVADQLKGKSPCPAQSEPKDVANEILTVPKIIYAEDDKHKGYMTKENPSSIELQKRSMRELKKMLKNLTLDGKPNCRTNNVAKEVERKRTALQALPENRMTAGEAQHDG